MIPALLQSPLSRFGDTAANAGVLTILDSREATAMLPVGMKTAVCSLGAASFRLFLMPIDGNVKLFLSRGYEFGVFSIAWKTVKQVEGGAGLQTLIGKSKTSNTYRCLVHTCLLHSVRKFGISKLYHGSFAAFGATWIGKKFWCNGYHVFDI